MGFPGGSLVKNPPANAGDSCSILRSERSPGEGNGSSLQYSCLGNPMDREAQWAIVHEVAKRVRHDLVTKQQINTSSRPCFQFVGIYLHKCRCGIARSYGNF